LTAGAIIAALEPPAYALDDLSVVSRDLYLSHAEDLAGALGSCAHARFLIEAGYGSDVDYCMTKDSLRAVPYFEKGMVKLL
jgi:2-phosphosulfolactate phosphatase